MVHAIVGMVHVFLSIYMVELGRNDIMRLVPWRMCGELLAGTRAGVRVLLGMANDEQTRLAILGASRRCAIDCSNYADRRWLFSNAVCPGE